MLKRQLQVLSLFIALICLSLSAPSGAQASESAWVLPAKSRYFEWQMGYGRFTQDNLQHEQLIFQNRYEHGILENTSFELAWPMLLRSRPNPSTASGERPLIVNNGFTDIYLGLRTQFFKDVLPENLALTLHLNADIPTGYSISRMPVIGERQLNLYGGLMAGYHFEPFEAYVQGGAGYRFRTQYDPKHARVLLARAEGVEIIEPADQFAFFLESGVWLSERLFASVNLDGRVGFEQEKALKQSYLRISPLLAWRFNSYFDLSAQYQQVLWQENSPALSQFLLGGHFRFGYPLAKVVGLRGGKVDFADYDDTL